MNCLPRRKIRDVFKTAHKPSHQEGERGGVDVLNVIGEIRHFFAEMKKMKDFVMEGYREVKRLEEEKRRGSDL